MCKSDFIGGVIAAVVKLHFGPAGYNRLIASTDHRAGDAPVASCAAGGGAMRSTIVNSHFNVSGPVDLRAERQVAYAAGRLDQLSGRTGSTASEADRVSIPVTPAMVQAGVAALSWAESYSPEDLVGLVFSAMLEEAPRTGPADRTSNVPDRQLQGKAQRAALTSGPFQLGP